MPEDGYEWKKYGQKFIKNIQKIRYLLRPIQHAYVAFYFVIEIDLELSIKVVQT